RSPFCLMSARLVCCETTSRNFSVKRCDKLGAPKEVLFVKNPTLMVFASGGIVAPLNETLVLQDEKTNTKTIKYVIK
ncbi:MAG: hypothetical protein Q8L81_14375, partial [Bacteroidota bacterium]|nr:hypothetical protein [Bacteroidota bacterium]